MQTSLISILNLRFLHSALCLFCCLFNVALCGHKHLHTCCVVSFFGMGAFYSEQVHEHNIRPNTDTSNSASFILILYEISTYCSFLCSTLVHLRKCTEDSLKKFIHRMHSIFTIFHAYAKVSRRRYDELFKCDL